MTTLPLPTLIRPVTSADLDAYRTLRLEALRLHPESFGADYETQAAFSTQDWLDRMGEGVFVADRHGSLVGMAGVQVPKGNKGKHNGQIWGVFVHPEARGVRLGDKLVGACIEWAKKNGLYILKLSVITSNQSAILCYARCGFSVHGVEPAMLFYNETYYDGLLMSRHL